MLKNKSVAAIAAPQFINIEPYNPLISQCEIKVLYVGENRNGSFITEEVAKDMANSLPGTPIVAAYREEIDDYGDHGKVVTIEDGEVKFSCKTRPYGFVAPDAKIWFQEFIDVDDFGNEIYRKYLMTTGYLWTGQFPEIQKAVDEGMPQSMELDEKSLQGHWAINNNSGVEFFIINDAIFSKLCILGSDVEPCFEGASVTAPEISKDFSKNSEFMNELFTMMNDFKQLTNKGGSDMLEEIETVETDFEDASESSTSESESSSDPGTAGEESQPSATEGESGATEEGSQPSNEEGSNPTEETVDPENINETGTEEAVYLDMVTKGLDSVASNKEQFAKNEEEDVQEEKEVPEDEDEDKKEVVDNACGNKKAATKHELEEYEQLKSDYAELSANYEEAKAAISSLNETIEALKEFKLNIENQQKDALIAKYHMLSDEDKAEVAANKENYSLEEIDAKLALLYVKKNVDFSTVTGEVEAETIEAPEANPVTTFSLDSAVDMTGVPDIVKALRAAK